MRRREFITLAGGVAAWPVAARGQETRRVARIGVFYGAGDADSDATQARLSLFRAKLASLGWIEGRNLIIDIRTNVVTSGEREIAARELIQVNPDVLISNGTPPSLELQRQTKTVPIVFINATDPLATGLITSVAKPGGNITGFSNLEFSIGGKWLGLLKDVAPTIKRVLVMLPPNNPGAGGELKAIESAGARLGVEVVARRVDYRDDIARALDVYGAEQNGGLIMTTFNAADDNRTLIIERAERYRIPAIYPRAIYTSDGGLMSYGAPYAEIIENAAVYVDRILRGEKPGDLPVQYPAKYELRINNRAAKAIGLTIPESFLILADEVIE